MPVCSTRRIDLDDGSGFHQLLIHLPVAAAGSLQTRDEKSSLRNQPPSVHVRPLDANSNP